MFGALMKLMKAKKMLPQISDTERLALEARPRTAALLDWYLSDILPSP